MPATIGGMGDCTTRRWPAGRAAELDDEGEEAGPAEGRYIFSGFCRSGAPCAWSSFWAMGRKRERFSMRKLAGWSRRCLIDRIGSC